MNFILTERCNKNCSFCFAKKDHENADGDMTFEYFKKVLDELALNNFANKNIALLGGEPTIAKNFKECLTYAIETGFHVVLLSNFIFKDDILAFLRENAEKFSPHMGILVNAADMRTETQRKLFKRNINELYNSYVINVGFTIPKNGTTEKFKEDVDKVFSLFDSISYKNNVRLSIEVPSLETQYSPIDDEEYGHRIVEAIKIFRDKELNVYFDEIVFPCLFNEADLEYFEKNVYKYSSTCKEPICDIFAGNKVRYCYPCRNIVAEYKDSIIQSYFDLNTINYEALKTWKSCKRCFYKMHKLCNGPCGAFIRPENEIAKE